MRDPAMRAHGFDAERRMQNEDHDFDKDPIAATSDDLSRGPGANIPDGNASSTREENEGAEGSHQPNEGAEGSHQPQQPLAAGPLAEALAEAPPGARADEDIQQEPEPGITVPLRPQTARENRMAAIRLQRADAEVQASAHAQEDWRNFDVSKALSALRSPEPQVRRKALQRLHLRWWHAGASAV